MALNLDDVRAEMPNYENYKDSERDGQILGIAVHHSATANRVTGAPTGNALAFFNYQVNTRGWDHGGYNYVIVASGQIEYALDEKIAAYHAGFRDSDDSEGLEFGQYWNNHYLAICVSGWFNHDRTYVDREGRTQKIPNNDVVPTEAQMNSLLALIQELRQKYDISVENVRVHRELTGNVTVCPGHNFDGALLRQRLRELDQANPEPPVDLQPEVSAGEHVVLLADTDQYLTSAMAYIWNFQPDVSFAVDDARGRWKYVTAVGDETVISESQLSRLRTGGALLVQRIAGAPDAAQATLDNLVEQNLRFLTGPAPDPTEPAKPEAQSYTVQPGDSLSLIALRFYGESQLWTVIFEANQAVLIDPARISPGQVLQIPPKP